MRIIVQKFGGTSLSSTEAREHAIRHIRQAQEEQYKVVVVVSAMGRKGEPYATDTLLDWIAANGGNSLPPRERDMLLCTGEWISAVTLCALLCDHGVDAVALSGSQAGIITNKNYGNAHILSIEPKQIYQYLSQDKVVIVTGFQGVTEAGDFTTLGRGGSDTTATALGSALHAEMVDIFTDVNGILTADPRIVEDARHLSQITYAEMCNMAHNGAKVIHPRAVEIAMQANVPLRVRSTFTNDIGTLITTVFVDRYVTGLAHVSNISQIQVNAVEGQYDLPLQVFKAMAANRISVDFINVNLSGVVYTVFDHELERAVKILKNLGLEPHCLPHCSKVSVIGGGMNGVPGIMASIVEALTEADIPILQSADSNTTIWVLIHNRNLINALKKLHHKFELHK